MRGAALVLLAAASSAFTPAPLRLRRRRPLLAPLRSAATDALAEAIAGTDRGIACDEAQREAIEAQVAGLEATQRGTLDLDESAAALFQNMEVAYVGQRSSKSANAAGGQWRGRTGRLLFNTETLFQHVLRPDLAVNIITFRFLSLVPGACILRGTFKRMDAAAVTAFESKYNRTVSTNAVKVDFDAPRVALGAPMRGGLLNLEIGPQTDVVLDVTYVDDDMRIARGGTSGTPFVFLKTALPSADCWRAITEKKPVGSRAVGGTLLGTAAIVGLKAVSRPVRIGAALVAVGAAALISSSGGIVVGKDADLERQTSADEE